MKLGKVEIIYIPPKKKEKLTRSKLINTLKISSAVLALLIIDMQKLYANPAMDKLDIAGRQIFDILQRIGYWAALLMAFWETIGAIKDGDVNKVWGITVKYAMGYATLYALPWIFDMISSIFV